MLRILKYLSPMHIERKNCYKCSPNLHLSMFLFYGIIGLSSSPTVGKQLEHPSTSFIFAMWTRTAARKVKKVATCEDARTCLQSGS
jgi:hypothetical protein